MKKFHITEDGPKACSAKDGNCPITQNTDAIHYTDLNIAQRDYEEQMRNETIQSLSKVFGVAPKKLNLPKIEITSQLHTKKGGSYYGLTIDENKVEKHLEAWKKEVGENNAQKMEQAKINRDGGYHFHITALTPKETRQLKKSEVKIEQPSFNVQLTGIGSVQDGEKEAWFITAQSSEIDEFRSNLGLPKHNLHITIGFKNGDVHNKPKDETSLKII